MDWRWGRGGSSFLDSSRQGLGVRSLEVSTACFVLACWKVCLSVNASVWLSSKCDSPDRNLVLVRLLVYM